MLQGRLSARCSNPGIATNSWGRSCASRSAPGLRHGLRDDDHRPLPRRAEFISVDNSADQLPRHVRGHRPWSAGPGHAATCKRQSVPIIWSQETYVSAGQGDLWDGQARFGYRTGVAMALHLRRGHFFLGVDRDQSLPKDRSELTRIVADLQLFAVHAQEAALRAS